MKFFMIVFMKGFAMVSIYNFENIRLPDNFCLITKSFSPYDNI
jgi:hypothetical protein